MKWTCKNCGHLQEDHWNGWAECEECNCVLFEYGHAILDDEDTENEVLTLEEDGV